MLIQQPLSFRHLKLLGKRFSHRIETYELYTEKICKSIEYNNHQLTAVRGTIKSFFT